MADDGMVGARKPLFPAQLRMCYVAVEDVFGRCGCSTQAIALDTGVVQKLSSEIVDGRYVALCMTVL